jgi:hypothetical protein
MKFSDFFPVIKSPIGEQVATLEHAEWVATNKKMETEFLYNQEFESTHCFGPNAFAEYLDSRVSLWLM